MFGEQRQRLLREDPWPNANMLAQELYAMFSPEQELTHDGPITLNVNGLVPPITLNFPDGSLPIIRVQRRGVPESTIGQDGQSDSEETPQQQEQQAGSRVFSGTVVSGSGSSYQVALSTGDTVSVTQLSIHADETIPEGTAVVVFRTTQQSAYFMQVPVWM